MIVWNLDDISVSQVLQYWQTKVKWRFAVKITFRMDWHFNNIDTNIVNAVVRGMWNVSICMFQH